MLGTEIYLDRHRAWYEKKWKFLAEFKQKTLLEHKSIQGSRKYTVKRKIETPG